MEPIKGILTRYKEKSDKSLSLVEFPKKINRKRVLSHAWQLFEGNGASVMLTFPQALQKAWSMEKNMVKNGGAIYHPYINLI